MYIIEAARDEDMAPVCQILWESYRDLDEDITEYYCRRSQECDPYFELDRVRILRVNDRIAATARIYIREVWDGGKHRPVGGIGAVATHPDFRGKGLSLPVLSDAMEYMRKLGPAYSMLYSDHRGLYERFGFQRHERITLQGVVRGNPVELPRSRDIDQAETIYERCNAQRPGAFRRSNEYWRMWVREFKLQSAYIAYSPNGNAYIIFNEDAHADLVNILDGGCDASPYLLKELLEQTFCGRTIRAFDIDETHVLKQSMELALAEKSVQPACHLMVAPLGKSPAPSAFSETCIDFF